MFNKIQKPVMSGKYSVSKNYHDYRYLQDDKIVLNNPHKGWYWHYIDNGFGRINYRKGVEDDYTLDFPCLNHLYLRFDWADIEKEEGIFDWYYIDEIVNKWSKYNYRFAFRVCCYEAGEIKYATPEWVREAGAKGYFCGNDCWQPDYGDEIFLEKLENFMKEFGKKFNGHPLVEFVDVGTYGTWGEGHTGYGSGNSFPTDVLIKHINLHLKYFPDTYVIMNDDMINASATSAISNTCKNKEAALAFIECYISVQAGMLKTGPRESYGYSYTEQQKEIMDVVSKFDTVEIVSTGYGSFNKNLTGIFNDISKGSTVSAAIELYKNKMENDLK